MYDGAVYSYSIHGVRVIVQGYESSERLRPYYTLRGWWLGWSICSWNHHPSRRDQDTTSDKRNESTGRDSKCSRFVPCSKHHQKRIWMEWLHEGLATQNHHHNAKHRHLLVRPPPTPFLLESPVQRAYQFSGLRMKWQRHISSGRCVRSIMPKQANCDPPPSLIAITIPTSDDFFDRRQGVVWAALDSACCAHSTSTVKNDTHYQL